MDALTGTRDKPKLTPFLSLAHQTIFSRSDQLFGMPFFFVVIGNFVVIGQLN